MVLLISFFSGFFLGMVFFGGLWMTVKRLPVAPHPLSTLWLSFVVRLALVVAGLYLLMDGSWERLLAALFGLLVARGMLIRVGQRPWRHRQIN